VIVIALVVVLVVASVSVYFLVVASPAPTSASRSSTRTTTSAPGPTTRSTSSLTGSAGVKTYSGTFNYSNPEGPGGELVYSNGTVKTYTSVQAASGSFTFSINPSTYTGSGSGRGTLTVTTSGFCSGRVTLPYTFQIPDATNILGGNITVFIGTPTPENFTQKLTCTATPTPGSTTGDTFPFLAIYPNEFNVAAVPVAVTQHLAGNVNYQFTINQTG
jgi:hypothetical protein